MCFRPAEAKMSKTCPECSAENDIFATNCEKCGSKLPEAPGGASVPGAPGAPKMPGMPPAPGAPGAKAAPKMPGAPKPPGQN